MPAVSRAYRLNSLYVIIPCGVWQWPKVAKTSL